MSIILFPYALHPPKIEVFEHFSLSIHKLCGNTELSCIYTDTRKRVCILLPLAGKIETQQLLQYFVFFLLVLGCGENFGIKSNLCPSNKQNLMVYGSHKEKSTYKGVSTCTNGWGGKSF